MEIYYRRKGWDIKTVQVRKSVEDYLTNNIQAKYVFLPNLSISYTTTLEVGLCLPLGVINIYK